MGNREKIRERILPPERMQIRGYTGHVPGPVPGLGDPPARSRTTASARPHAPAGGSAHVSREHPRGRRESGLSSVTAWPPLALASLPWSPSGERGGEACPGATREAGFPSPPGQSARTAPASRWGVSRSRSRSSVLGRRPEPRAPTGGPFPSPGPPHERSLSGRTGTLAGCEPRSPRGLTREAQRSDGRPSDGLMGPAVSS